MSRVGTVAAVLVVGLVASAGTAFAVGATTPDPINACVASKDGALRVVPAGQACKRGETPLAWNISGPQGAPGQDGQPGQDGAPGTGGVPILRYNIGQAEMDKIRVLPPTDAALLDTPTAWPRVGSMTVPVGKFETVELGAPWLSGEGLRCQVDVDGVPVLRGTSTIGSFDFEWVHDLVAPGWETTTYGFSGYRTNWEITTPVILTLRCSNPTSQSETLRFTGGATVDTLGPSTWLGSDLAEFVSAP